jgi:hypothetical protein
MSVQLQIAPPAGAGLGGYIQGLWGNYQPNSDGSYTVDSRDVSPLLVAGFTYVRQSTLSYTLPLAPGAATVGQIVASGALSNGTVAITHQPDTMRPVNVEVGTGTAAITAGTVTTVYVANDGTTQTDVLSLACPASSAVTQGLSKGVVTITSITVAGVVGGTSPWLRASTTAAVSLPVAPGAIDFAVNREYDAGATIAIGALATALGSITPTTAPNATVTFSFAYTYVAPTS